MTSDSLSDSFRLDSLSMSYATSAPATTTGGQGNTPVSNFHRLLLHPLFFLLLLPLLAFDSLSSITASFLFFSLPVYRQFCIFDVGCGLTVKLPAFLFLFPVSLPCTRHSQSVRVSLGARVHLQKDFCSSSLRRLSFSLSLSLSPFLSLALSRYLTIPRILSYHIPLFSLSSTLSLYLHLYLNLFPQPSTRSPSPTPPIFPSSSNPLYAVCGQLAIRPDFVFHRWLQWLRVSLTTNALNCSPYARIAGHRQRRCGAAMNWAPCFATLVAYS